MEGDSLRLGVSTTEFDMQSLVTAQNLKNLVFSFLSKLLSILNVALLSV